MWSVLKLFDAYSLRARVFPALVAGLPTLAWLFVMVPWTGFNLSQVVASIMAFVLLFAFADVARRAGRTVEAKLGTRATPELWHHDNSEIDALSKERYKEFVAAKLKTSAPTAEDEVADIAKANGFYHSAGNFLRDNTRDTKKFKLLFEELITYGFRRNLLGLKPIAFIMNGLVFLASAGTLFTWWEEPFLPNLHEKLLFVMLAVFFHSVYMVFAVGKNAVREASKAYGMQLILSCELLMQGTRSTTSRTRKKPTTD